MTKTKVILDHRRNKTRGITCPYLSDHPKQICVRMVEAGLDGRVSQFDVEHFCMGNPKNCYYFRFSPPQPKSNT